MLNYHAYVYDFNVPSKYKSTFTNFTRLCNSEFNLNGVGQVSFASLANNKFTAFGKNGATGSDLYEDVVAPGLSTGLTVESWCGGTFGDGCQLSPCQGAPVVDPSNPQRGESDYSFDSIVIEELKFPGGQYFRTKYNHAKFALSYPQPNWVCPADINMETTQRRRGGGAICFQDSNFYGLLSGAISRLNTTCS